MNKWYLEVFKKLLNTAMLTPGDENS